MSVTETKTDSGVVVVPDLVTRYRLAESQLALLPPPAQDEDDEWYGLRWQCEEVMELIERLSRAEAELAQWKTWCIMEIAVRNPSVAEYMEHWEGRATKCEAEQNQFLSLVCKYQCNPTWQLSNFEAIRNHLEAVHRLCNENYDWAKRLEAELARLQWQPITPENFPKIGDEVWRTHSNGLKLREPEIRQVRREEVRAELWLEMGYTHFRPINPPKETA